jgi:hypothetical protein
VIRSGVSQRAEAEAAGKLYRACVTPVTSTSSIRPVDSRLSPGVSRFPAYFSLISPDPLALAPMAASRRIESRGTPVRLPPHAPRIDPSLWPTIAERARFEGLRDLAAAYGVSHETIRGIVRRARLAHCEPPAAPTMRRGRGARVLREGR